MNKASKIFLITFIVSLPFWWGMNALAQNLEEFFYWHQFAANPKIMSAQAAQMAFAQNLHTLKPLRNNGVPEFETDALAAISVLVDQAGKEKVLLAKNVDQSLPIASVSKLMTANVVLNNYDLAKEIMISKSAVEQEENLGKLIVGSTLTVEQLLYPLLMESSNDAAYALFNDYDGMNRERFISLMNAAAQDLGLTNTYFFNPTGLEPDEDKETKGLNYSTAADLVKLAKESLKMPLIWEVLQTPRINLYGPTLVNGNQLLGKVSGILGGKTGYTEKAQGCFLLVVEAPKSKGVLINVILGTADRFSEMEKLIDWDRQAYDW